MSEEQYNFTHREATTTGTRATVTPVTPGPSTLLVCTANVCRSPMAERLWRDAAHRLRRLLPVTSVGLEARPGSPADERAAELLAERGLDLSDHRSRRFQPVGAMRHDLILVMEPMQQRRVLVAAPALAGRVHLLGQWGVGAIDDPYGKGHAAYEVCVTQLERAIVAWMNRIVSNIDANRFDRG